MAANQWDTAAFTPGTNVNRGKKLVKLYLQTSGTVHTHTQKNWATWWPQTWLQIRLRGTRWPQRFKQWYPNTCFKQLCQDSTVLVLYIQLTVVLSEFYRHQFLGY